MSSKSKRRILNAPQTELTNQLRDDFERLLGKFDYDFKRGEIIKGTIVSHEGNGYQVDIGAKCAAFLPDREVPFAAPEGGGRTVLEVGATIEFYIMREENEDGQMTLSLKRVSQAQNWSEIEALASSDQVIECTVMSTVKGGLLIDVFGLRGFVPMSHMRLKGTVEEVIGQKLPFKILSIDKLRNNIILSHRKVMSEQMAENRKDLFSNLSVGSILYGDVVRLTDFGAFVDIGGIDGLLPLSQMSWRWVEHPSDVLKVADKVKVEIISIDAEKQRVSLSIKSLTPDPWTEVVKTMQQGQKVAGKVTRLKHFGAFVEVYPGVEALLPSRDVADYEAQNGQPLQPGTEIETFINKFNPEERRIGLGLNAEGSSNAQQLVESN